MKNSTCRRRLVTAFAVAAIIVPAAQAGEGYTPAYPENLSYPGEGITAPAYQPGIELNEFGIPTSLTIPGRGFVQSVPDAAMPADVTYPGEGIVAPAFETGIQLDEFGIPKDLTIPGGGFVQAVPDAAMPADVRYPGEGIVAPLPQATTVVQPQGESFDFADAGVGAGIALGAALLLAAAAMASRRHRRLAHM